MSRPASPLPNLTSLSSIHADGSHRKIHPADVRGRFAFWRKAVAGLLLAIYIALPWIPINGHPAVFLDVEHRRFHFAGLTLATQDLWVFFFLVTGLGFSLFYVTALFGRLWCGWTCPYTVFLEHVYRRIERWIDGDAPARRRLDEAPWTGGKIARRVLKHSLWALVSLAIAHIFLSYFVSLGGLYEMMRHSPQGHWFAFGVVLFLTGCLYFAFSWFREQFCIILCPYGRLQSALTDDHSVVIGYDRRRGEPRGRAADQGTGDCVSCNRCVQVCPTGIDIRNGMQLECIGCAACVDACDEIMKKVGRQPGLIRYDSFVGIEGGKTRLIRPRTVFYTFLLIAGIGAFAFAASRIEPLRANVVRMIGAPYYQSDGMIRNQFLVRVINKRNDPATYRIKIEGERLPGLNITGDEQTMTLGPLGEEQKAVVLALPEKSYQGPVAFRARVTDTKTGDSVLTRVFELLGPDPRLKANETIDPKKYLQ